jgi:phosphoglycerol transferase
VNTLILFLTKYRHFFRLLIRFIVYFVAFFLVFFGLWINRNFGEPSLEQILYHLQFGMEGLVDTDPFFIRSFINECLLSALGIALGLVVIEVSLAYYLIHRPKANVAPTSTFYHSFEKFCKGLYWLINHRAPLYSLLAAFVYFAVQFSLLTYTYQKFARDYFSENYLNPKKVSITLKQPKNLVLIYVESLESSYRDKGLFGKNLVKSLDDIGGVSFSNFRQAPGTNFTIAGITATQCGIPLKSITLYDGNDQGQNIKSFLPSAICLGDILHAHGYHNVYMGGDALPFSGKGMFFKDHHYDEAYGREELKGSITKAQMNYWGLYDDDLLPKVKAKLIELHDKKQPFNLTFTTIDTHGPDGHFSKLCIKNGAKKFEDIVECTSNQVTDFVNFIKKKGYLKDTNVVILGDHLAMYNPVYEQLESIHERHIYNQFISRKKITKNRDHILHFDMFPTILEFIGFHVEGGKLGLGFSAITANTAQPSIELLDEMESDLLNESETYIDLWKSNDVINAENYNQH